MDNGNNMSNVKSLVEVDSLIKSYKEFTAVKGVSFKIHEGEIFGFLGPNGAGKTTTISIIACLLEQTAGSVSIDGRDLAKEKDKIKQIVGVVPQELALYPPLSARDNLLYFGAMYGLSGRLLKERVAEALEIVGLADRENDEMRKFSGGMQRRLNLAAGLMHRPKLLLLDEPTVGVDPQSRNQIFKNIRRLNKEEGMTVLYTTHYMEEAEQLCDRVAIMDKGQIMALDSPKGLIEKYGHGMMEITIEEVDEAIQGILSDLENIPNIKKAFSEEGKITLELGDMRQTLVDVINYMNEKNYKIDSMNILEPSLENVFLKLTGTHLRDTASS